MPIAFRMFQYVEDGCNGEEIFNRQEGLFFQKIPPLMQNTDFGMPKSYFIGIDDNGNSSFTQYVIQNKPPRVRSVLVIEDLSHWKSLTACTCLTKEEVIACKPYPQMKTLTMHFLIKIIQFNQILHLKRLRHQIFVC